MPRDFDSDEVARGEQLALRFTELVDCPACGQTFHGVFHDDSMSVEDLTDPPIGEHTCPECGHQFVSEMTGWTFYSEAG